MLKLSEIKVGDVLTADAGFICLTEGDKRVVCSDGELYIHCKHGFHYLNGQVDFNDPDKLVGLSRG